MSAITTVLSSCLAVTAAGAVWFSQRSSQPVVVADAVPESRMVIARPEILTVKNVPIPDPVFVPLDDPISSVAEPPVEKPVQSLEERGDAMLFEIEALSFMPFDEAIVFPFE